MAESGWEATIDERGKESQQSGMLVAHSSPEIQSDEQFGWQLTYWLGDAFDYGIPFRKALAEIVTVLGQVRDADLNIPPFAVGEDFVEGSLHFGPHALGVYFEYSLGYLALRHEDKQVLTDVASTPRAGHPTALG